MNPQVKLVIVRKLLQQSNSLHDGQMIIYILLKKIKKKLFTCFFLARFNESCKHVICLYGSLRGWLVYIYIWINYIFGP